MVSGQRGVRLPPPPTSAPPTAPLVTDTGIDKENSNPEPQHQIRKSNNTEQLQRGNNDENHTTKESKESTYRETLLQRAEESGEFCPQAWVNLIHHDWEDARQANDEKHWRFVYDTVQTALQSVHEPYKTDASWVKCLLYDARLTSDADEVAEKLKEIKRHRSAKRVWEFWFVYAVFEARRGKRHVEAVPLMLTRRASPLPRR
eukprot:gb/GECG01002687.1/.p1 GENE.gb/GECG01002687.1/~~gb/GECG01002687.1/.p1  ORF type:complete len:203 (+),score=29.25 gb/GECG01002687.1/:1-609(+)